MKEKIRALYSSINTAGIYPVDVNEIVSDEGLSIVYFDPTKNAKSTLKGVSGMLDKAKKVIYINVNDSVERRRFTIAHELGHYLYGHNSEEYGLNFREDVYNFSKKSSTERQADSFASEILMPSPLVKKVIDKYGSARPTLVEIAELFGVSLKAMKYKLDTLQLTDKIAQ